MLCTRGTKVIRIPFLKDLCFLVRQKTQSSEYAGNKHKAKHNGVIKMHITDEKRPGYYYNDTINSCKVFHISCMWVCVRERESLCLVFVPTEKYCAPAVKRLHCWDLLRPWFPLVQRTGPEVVRYTTLSPRRHGTETDSGGKTKSDETLRSCSCSSENPAAKHRSSA